MIEMANGTAVCRANIERLERERDEARDEAAVFKRTLDKRDEQIENLREQVRVLRIINVAMSATEPKP